MIKLSSKACQPKQANDVICVRYCTMRFILILFALWTFGSCDLINPEEEIPAFIEIDEITVDAKSGEGSESNNVTDAWIFVNDNYAGTYELPARVPVLHNGAAEVLVLAGIKENGISLSRKDYTFYAPYIENLTLVPSETFLVEPEVEYEDFTNFSFIEDFEMGSIIGGSTISTVNLQRTAVSSEVFEGANAGKVELTNTGKFFEGISSLAYELPQNGSDIFVELDYKSDIEFSVGFQSNSSLISKNYVVTVTAKPDNWSKIYINLGPAIAAWEANDYNLLIKATLPSDRSSATLLFDNLKLIH